MNKKDYILGLDLGVGSVGSCAMEIDDDGQTRKVLDLAVNIFPSTQGDMEVRRGARGTRRLIRRRKARVTKTKNLFFRYELLTREEIEKFFNDTVHKYANPYELKVKGINEKLNNDELFICLIHYCKQRGFKSNRKNKEEAKDTKAATEEQKLLFAIQNTTAELSKSGETISHYLLNNDEFKNKIRNTSGDYKIGITREMILDEANKLLDKQIELNVISEQFKNDYFGILTKQLSFAEGPEEPSKYHDPLNKMIGKCKFDGKDKAPKLSYTVELFTLVQKLNDLKYKPENQTKYINLSKEQVSQIVEIAKSKNVTYKVIATVIGGKPTFKGLLLSKKEYTDVIKNLTEDKTLEQTVCEQKLKISLFDCKHSRTLIKSLKKLGIEDLSPVALDEIANILSRYKTDDEIKKKIFSSDKFGELNDDQKLLLVNLDDKNYSEFASLSLDIIYKLLPLMIDEGLGYSEAMNKVGLNHTISKKKEFATEYLPSMTKTMEELELGITNKVVLKTLKESKNIINEYIRLYGKPKSIHIEMARELTKTDDERMQLINEQLENKIKTISNKTIMLNKYSDTFKSLNDISSQDVLKYRLFKEQAGICPYTLAMTNDVNKSKINEKDLFTEMYEIDHIIPYSLTFDDTYSNKTLVNKSTNQVKSNKIPMLSFANEAGLDKYINFIKLHEFSNTIGFKKKEKYLCKEVTDEMRAGFNARDLNDTRYATKSLKKILEYYFNDVKIKTFNGGVTSKLKGVWGLKNLTHSLENKEYKKNSDVEDKLKEAYEKLSKKLESEFLSKKWDEYKAVEKLERERDKKDRSNHLHHALDASIIACATDKLRVRVQMHEIYTKCEADEKKNVEIYEMDELTGEIIVNKVGDIINYDTYTSLTNNMDPKRFPTPYMNYTNEIKLRLYERDTNKLKSEISKLGSYSVDELNNLQPVYIKHKEIRKTNGQLHKQTIYGVGKDLTNSKDLVLTNRINVVNEKFTRKDLEKLYDKDHTQKGIYLAVSKWMGNYENGLKAYTENGNKYPINNNGRPILKIKCSYGKPKEQILIRPKNKHYVDKTDVLRIDVYRKDDKLYFTGLDIYRIMNEDKEDLKYLLWSGQGKNNVLVSKEELKSFEKVISLYKNQLIRVTMKNGSSCICNSCGFSSGLFQVDSNLGDGIDLFTIFSKLRSRYQITVSTIDNISLVKQDLLGKIYEL